MKKIKKCSKCGISEQMPKTSSYCKACRSDYAKQWHKKKEDKVNDMLIKCILEALTHSITPVPIIEIKRIELTMFTKIKNWIKNLFKL